VNGDDALLRRALIPGAGAALLDGAEELGVGGVEDGDGGELRGEPFADVARERVIVGGTGFEGNQLRFWGDRLCVL
jgi:hypothetical protein